jgi:hypothetical protein
MRASTYAFIAAALYGVWLVVRRIQQWSCAFSSDWTVSADGVSPSLACAGDLGLGGIVAMPGGGYGIGSIEEAEEALAASLPSLQAERAAAQEEYASDVSRQIPASGWKAPGSAITGGDGSSWWCPTPCWYQMTEQEKHWYCNDCDTSKAGWWLYCLDIETGTAGWGMGQPWLDTERCG